MSENIYSLAVLNSIIDGHRELINQRYQFEHLTLKYDLPDWLTEEKVYDLRNYFLKFIYPPIDKREELNSAFRSLDGHVKNPQHLFQIFLDSSSLIFKYGIHLP